MAKFVKGAAFPRLRVRKGLSDVWECVCGAYVLSWSSRPRGSL